MSRRDRRRRPQHSQGAQPDTSTEDFSHSKTLALNIIREILTSERPDEDARVRFAVYQLLNNSRGTAVGAIVYLAQLAAGIEHDVGSAT